jgi:hypothetical protein
MRDIPREFFIGDVYLSPALVAAVIGTTLAVLTTRLLNHFRLSRFFYYPPIIFLSMAVIYTLLVGAFLVPM